MEDEVKKMGRSKSQLATQHKYEKANYDQIALRFKKSDKIIPLLNLATELTHKSKNEYIKHALQLQFEADGITIDQLPTSVTPSKSEPKQPKQYIIYMITEQYDRIDDEEKYIATFPTLNMAEKYAKNKFEKKAHPNEWSYTIYGRSVEGDNKSDACNKLKAMIREELKYDKEHGIKSDGSQLTYVDRLNERAPADYIDVILYDGEYVEEDLSIEDFEL